MPDSLVLKWSVPKRSRYGEVLRGRGPTGYQYYLMKHGSTFSWSNQNSSRTKSGFKSRALAQLAADHEERWRLEHPGDANARRAAAKWKASLKQTRAQRLKGEQLKRVAKANEKSKIFNQPETRRWQKETSPRASRSPATDAAHSSRPENLKSTSAPSSSSGKRKRSSAPSTGATRTITPASAVGVSPRSSPSCSGRSEWAKAQLIANPTTISGYKVHPAAAEMPLLSEPELTELAAAIKRNGLRQSVVLHEGKIVDGRNRLLACEIAGVKAATTELSGEGVVEFVADMNLRRRHIPQDVRAMIAARLVRMNKAEAKAAAKVAPRKLAPGASSPATVHEAAKSYGLGERTVHRAVAIQKKSPELAAKVLAGKATLKQAEKQIRHADQVAKVKAYVPPAGEYSVIAADPPWPFDDQLGGSANSRGELPYPAMTLAEIAAKPPPAAKDCLLFLWTTNAHLIDGSATAVLKEWGFTPKALITWSKGRLGLGRYIRNSTEQCVIAVKGNPVVTLKDQSSLIEAAPGAHSEKPAEAFALFESLSPSTSRFEMYARKARPGWVTSGAEAPQVEGEKVATGCACAGFEPAESSLSTNCVCGHSVDDHGKNAGPCERVKGTTSPKRRPPMTSEQREAFEPALKTLQEVATAIDDELAKKSAPADSYCESKHPTRLTVMCSLLKGHVGRCSHGRFSWSKEMRPPKVKTVEPPAAAKLPMVIAADLRSAIKMAQGGPLFLCVKCGTVRAVEGQHPGCSGTAALANPEQRTQLLLMVGDVETPKERRAAAVAKAEQFVDALGPDIVGQLGADVPAGTLNDKCEVAGCKFAAALGEKKCATHLVAEEDAAEAAEAPPRDTDEEAPNADHR